MPQPTAGDVYVSAPLTNVSVAYMQMEDGFIADRVFPNVPVEIQGGQYWQYDRADWNRIEARPRANGTESAGSGWDLTQDTYFAIVEAVHKDIDDPTRANSKNSFNMDRDATNWVTRQLMMRRDKKWAAAYFTTGKWTTDLTGVAAAPGAGQFLQWNDAASKPVSDIDTQRLAMARLTGYRPNKLVIGPQVFSALKSNPDILDRIKYTQRGQVTLDLLAGLFEVDEVMVPYVTEETAVEGAADVYAFMYGKNALLVYAAPNPGLMIPSAGYTLSWTGYLGAGQAGNRIKKFRMEQIASDRVEGEMAFDQKLVAPDLGIFFSAAVA